MASSFLALSTPLLVLATAVLVLLVDLFQPADEDPPEGGPTAKIGAGIIALMGLVGALAATWIIPAAGDAFGGAFRLDAFTLYMHRILLTAGALGVLGALSHADRRFPRRQAEYHLLLLFSLSGMLLLAGARELITLVVAFELMGLPLTAMAAMHKKDKGAVEGALKLYLTSAISSATVLYGLSFVVGATGTTWIAEIANAPSSVLLTMGAMLSLAGMGFKIGAVPFHMWVPDTYEGAPTPFVAFLSVAPKAAGFAAMVRFVIEGLGAHRTTWWPVLLTVAVSTLVLGNLLALPQKNIKRLLAYSGIAHIGLLILAFGVGSSEGVGILLFYLATYVFTNMGAFFVVEVIGGTDDLSEYNGLARRAPALGFAMLLFLLSLGGIPFMAGFWAKFLLFWALWAEGFWILVLLGASLAVLALFYYLRVARSIYIEEPAEDAPPVQIPRSMVWAISIAVAGVVGMGIVPRPFIDAALDAARVVVGG